MYTVKRIQNSNCENLYDYRLENDDIVILLSFEGNLDFYMSAWDKNNNQQDTIIFPIDKSNYQIYSCFDRLFNTIIDATIYKTHSEDLLFFDDDEIKERLDRIERMNKRLKDSYTYKELIRDGNIVWRSDDGDIDSANTLTIEHNDDMYFLKFKRNNRDLSFSIPIRFRNSGSDYEPFNLAFMEFYNSLQNYDPEYHQIHLEEVFLELKLTK